MRRAPRVRSHALLPGVALLVLAAAAPAAEIRVCENSRMRPPCVDLRHGVNDLRDWGISNRISSFEIGSGSWLLCTGTDFGGRCEVFDQGRDNLHGTPFQDAISSLRPVRRGSGGSGGGGWAGGSGWERAAISVFTDRNYSGKSWVFSEDVRDLGEMGLSNQLSSVRILGGSWRLCRERDFRECVDVIGDVPNLRDLGLNDRVRSLQSVRAGGGGGGWGGPSGQGRFGITVFTDVDYRGRSLDLDDSVRDLSSVGLGNQLSSVRVRGGRWRLCRKPGFRDCFEVSRDTPDLRNLGLNDQVSSVERIATGGGGWGGSAPEPEWGMGSSPDTAVLYEGTGFRGRSVRVEGSSSNLKYLGFNDKAWSVRLRGRWLLCSDANYRGECVTVTGDVADLSRLGLEGALSSIRRER